MNQRKQSDSFKDQFTLLLLLHKLKERGFQTQRLKLEKLVYLTDVFGTILKEKPTAYTFRVYNDGNVDMEITITETNNLPAGTTVTWSIASPFVVTKTQVFRSTTLTITVPDDPGTGTYTWTMDAAVA